MKQATLADSGFKIATKQTLKRIFLEEMNFVVRWASLVGIIQGYASLEKSGQPQFPIETMSRIHLPQLLNNYSDPEMPQTKKLNQYHFGMKARIGIDDVYGLPYTPVTTAADAHTFTQAQNLVHGQETVVFSDSDYCGLEKREETKGHLEKPLVMSDFGKILAS